jgi:hypothetical protein
MDLLTESRGLHAQREAWSVAAFDLGKIAMEIVPRRSRWKNTFVAAATMVRESNRFLAAKRDTNQPAASRKSLCTETILPAPELETPSDLCDTKF